MKRLGLGIALWTAGGCVVPQDENYINELPVPRNRPPRIVESHVDPPDRIIRGYGTDLLCELDFSVVVEDPDTADRLTVSFFVDYNPNQPRGADFVYTVAARDNKVVRDERATYHVRFNSGSLSYLDIPGEHVVEAIVSDTALVGREPEPRILRLPDGTITSDPGYSATYVWFVKTEAGGNCR